MRCADARVTDPFRCLAPLQPFDLPAQEATHVLQMCALQARLGPHHVLLQLLDQPGAAFGTHPELFAPKLGDLQPEVADHVLGGRDHGAA